jgi:hypothetical protein
MQLKSLLAHVPVLNRVRKSTSSGSTGRWPPQSVATSTSPACGMEAAGEVATWMALGRADARAGRAFHGVRLDYRKTGNQKPLAEAYSQGFWSEFDRLRFERGDYDLL